MANLIQCLPSIPAAVSEPPPRYTEPPTSRTENSCAFPPMDAFICMSATRGRRLNDTLPSMVPCPGTLPERRYEAELSRAPLLTAFWTAATGAARKLSGAERSAEVPLDAAHAAVPHSTAPVSNAPATRNEVREIRVMAPP